MNYLMPFLTTFQHIYIYRSCDLRGIEAILKFPFQKNKIEISKKILHFRSRKIISLRKEFKINLFDISKNDIICARAAKVTMVVNSLWAEPIL